MKQALSRWLWTRTRMSFREVDAFVDGFMVGSTLSIIPLLIALYLIWMLLQY